MSVGTLAVTLDGALRRTCRMASERIAVRSGSADLTFGELETAASAFATGLRHEGVRRGDRVAILLQNGVEAALAIYGTLCAGAAIVPLNPGIKADKLKTILRDCSAAMLVTSPALLRVAEEAQAALPTLRMTITGDGAPPNFLSFSDVLAERPRTGEDALELDLAAILYTSGSSGTPKGVALTHRNMIFAATSIAAYLEMSSADRVLSVLPLSFDYGLYQLLLCVHVGATLVLEPGVGYPGRFIDLLTEHDVTGFPGVPTLFRVLLALPWSAARAASRLRFLTSTGAALSRNTILGLSARFPDARLYSMYGLTECKRVSYLPPAELDRRPDSVGIAIPGTEVWIEDDTGRRLGPGQVGELMVRGPHVMVGYWNDPTASAECLRNGRWPWERTLATGDLFRTDEDGFLYFVGRRDDMFKSRGEKVSPREVEDVLLAAPGVLDAAVVGVPHELLGHAVCAHVSPQPGAVLEPDALAEFCRARLEDYLVPSRIVIHEALPKTANGKIDRRALVEGRRAPRAMPGRQPPLATLLTECRRLVGCAATDVPPGVSLADWTSVSRLVEATGDENPLYLDVCHGARSWWRTLIAPPWFVLGIIVPESTGALSAKNQDVDVVDVLSRVELAWVDHIRLGDRVSGNLEIVGAEPAPSCGDDALEIISHATYRREGRRVATATGVVRLFPLRLDRDLFVDREMHAYTPAEIERIEAALAKEPPARGPRPRFHADVVAGEPLPETVRGPFTWSEFITWSIAEGRPAPAGNLRYRNLLTQPGHARPHGATLWPVSDRRQARHDLLACKDVGFAAPCARAPFIVALAAQHITTWMGDDAFLRRLSVSLEEPVLYGDTIWLTGQVRDTFVEETGGRRYSAVSVESCAVNQLGTHAFHATAVVYLPAEGHPVVLPVDRDPT